MKARPRSLARRFAVPVAILALAGASVCVAETVRCELHDVALRDNAVRFDGVATCDAGPARIHATFDSEWQRLRSNDALEIDVQFRAGHAYAIDADRIVSVLPAPREPAPVTREFSWGLAVVEDSKRLIGYVANRDDVIILVDYPRPRVFLDRIERDGSRVTVRLTKKRRVAYGGITLAVRFWSSDGRSIGEAHSVRVDRLMEPFVSEVDLGFEIPGAIPAHTAAITLQVTDREVLSKKEYKRRLKAG